MKEEAELQKSLVNWFRCNFPDYIIFSVPNEAAYRNSARFHATGMLNGAPDLVCLLPYGKTLFLEVKTSTGKQSTPQKVFEFSAKNLEHQYYIIRDLQDLKSVLQDNLYVEDWHGVL